MADLNSSWPGFDGKDNRIPISGREGLLTQTWCAQPLPVSVVVMMTTDTDIYDRHEYTTTTTRKDKLKWLN